MNEMNEKLIVGIIITSLLIIVGLLAVNLKNKQSSIDDLNKELKDHKSSVQDLNKEILGHKSSVQDLSFKLSNKQSEIDDVIAKFKNASWILNNQEQKFANSTLLTEDMNNCMIDKIISKVGLSNMIVNMSFYDLIKSLISDFNSSNSNILPATTDFLNTMNTLDGTIQICTVGKSCNIPPSSVTVPGCNYTL
jgi:uncharacterized membrane-anchored protein YhcB (DUF1043 family)